MSSLIVYIIKLLTNDFQENSIHRILIKINYKTYCLSYYLELLIRTYQIFKLNIDN